MLLRSIWLAMLLALWCVAGAALPIVSVHSRQAIADQPSHEWGLLAEADASGQLTTTYGWHPQKDNSVAPLYARTPDAAHPGQWRTVYYHNDHLGTPQRITDKSGAVIWAADYDAYGKAITRTTADSAKAITNNLRYPGQYWDAETGLHYNDRRYYDPETGRYLSSDPIGYEGGINLYAYAGAAPGTLHRPHRRVHPMHDGQLRTLQRHMQRRKRSGRRLHELRRSELAAKRQRLPQELPLEHAAHTGPVRQVRQTAQRGGGSSWRATASPAKPWCTPETARASPP